MLKLALVIASALSCHHNAVTYPPDPSCSSTQEPTDDFGHYLTETGHDLNQSITVGFLGAYGDTQVVLGALPVAVDAVNRDPLLLPGRELKFVARDVGTRGPDTSALPIRAMTRMKEAGTVAFIGPDASCSSEALVAAAWNLPMISYKCADKLVSDKRIYQTFVRTLAPSTKVSKSVVALLRSFDWNTFVIVSGKSPAWAPQVSQAITDLARKYEMTVTDVYQFDDYIPKDIDEIKKIVRDTFQRTRVYVFVGEHIALVDLVSCLSRGGLLERGEYAVVSVDDEIYDPQKKRSIVHRDYLDPFLHKGDKHRSSQLVSFKSVLKLTPSHPRNPKYREICDEFKRISVQTPFCVPYHPTIFDSINVPIEGAHIYDAVMIYARAVTEMFEAGEDPRNGTAVVRRIINRTYHSVQGYDVFIDKNGDAEGNFTVVALLDDRLDNGSVTMSMQPVGYFQYTSNNSELPEFKYYNDSRCVQWPGGRQPVAVPACGFQGEKCKRDKWSIGLMLAFMAGLSLVATTFALKHYRYEQKLASLLWKIDMRDVTIIPTAESSLDKEKPNMVQICRTSVLRSIVPDVSPKRAYTSIGLYKGNIVAIKAIHKRSVDITRSIRKELKQIREVRHENLITFIGACAEAGNLCILTAYCARGSLEDVLANEDLHLDNMFVSSLVADIIKL